MACNSFKVVSRTLSPEDVLFCHLLLSLELRGLGDLVLLPPTVSPVPQTCMNSDLKFRECTWHIVCTERGEAMRGTPKRETDCEKTAITCRTLGSLITGHVETASRSKGKNGQMQTAGESEKCEGRRDYRCA